MRSLNDLSIEELEALDADPSKRDELLKDETEVEAEVPEPETEPEPADEVVADETETPKAEDTPEPAEDLEKEELLAKIAALEASQKAQESRLGKFAGEADYWRKQAERKAPEPRQDEALEYTEPDEKPRAAPPSRDSIAAWAVTQAIQAGANEFSVRNPESNDLQAEMAAYLRDTGHDPARVLESDDPIFAQRETQRVLEEAFWHVKAAHAQKRTADIATRKAEQFGRQKEAKQRASVSGSGGVPAPKPKAKTLDEMSIPELEELHARLSR